MAEEDLIWARNRHMFGGIGPSNMLGFTLTSVKQNGSNAVNIDIKLPLDTVIEGQTLCSVAGAVIRRSETGYPKTEFDGIKIADVEENCTIVDSNVEDGKTYYYSAFPYTDQLVFNRNKKNRAEIEINGYTYIYGYDLTLSDTNPTTRISYPSDVDNASYNAAYMDFTSGSFNYGNWPSDAGAAFMPRPCMVYSNGTVAYYLDPNDYTKKEDGSASDITNTSFDGNAMMEWPKIYTYRTEENGVYKFRCSDKKIDSAWDCWCNYDKNDNEIEHFYTPIYFGSLDSNNKMRSLSGVTSISTKNMSNELSYAKANGDDWSIETLVDHLLIQDLLVMISKCSDTQSKFGMGNVRNTGYINNGSMDAKGMFWGSSSSNLGVKVFGMENLWGNKYRRKLGWLNLSGTSKFKLTRGAHDGSTATDYNLTGDGYTTIDVLSFSSSGYNYYITETATMGYGRIPYKASSNTPINEYDSFTYRTSGDCSLVTGGYNESDEYGGAFTTSFQPLTAEYSYVGSALSLKPTA